MTPRRAAAESAAPAEATAPFLVGWLIRHCSRRRGGGNGRRSGGARARRALSTEPSWPQKHSTETARGSPERVLRVRQLTRVAGAVLLRRSPPFHNPSDDVG